MSKTSTSSLAEVLRIIVRLCENLSSRQEVEQLYAAGIQAVHDVVKPDRAYVVMPDLKASTASDKSAIAIRIGQGAEHLGFFMLHFDAPRKFSEEETLLTETIAAVTAGAISRYNEEQKLKEALADAQQKQRLKDDFVSIVAHELQGPLMTVLGAVSILRTKSEHAPIGVLDMIDRNARAQAKIISDLLDLARIESGKVELHRTSVDAVALLREVVEELQAGSSARKVAIRFTAHSDPIVLNGDQQRLHQVFWNLLSNSVRFASPAGAVEIDAALRDKTAEVRFRDNGAGIDPHFLPHVFDRFRQENRGALNWHDGLGLGLSIAKQFVELHGGTVAAESEGVGKGATFIVTLPWG
jgi:signal transduction histidine kinase